jgi:hypothetical protein
MPQSAIRLLPALEAIFWRDVPISDHPSFFESRDTVNVAAAYHELDEKSKKAIKEVIKLLAIKNADR